MKLPETLSGIETIPTAVGVAFLTGPMLLALVAGSGISAISSTVGAASGELFRATRLPPLPFPNDTNQHTKEPMTPLNPTTGGQ